MILRGNLARHLMSAAVFNAEAGAGGGGGGGGEKPAATPPAGDPAKPAADPAASVLFPNEGGDPKPAAGDPPKEGGKPADWKEYVPDPAKSEAENAAAKAEHDKSKPAAADALDVVPADGKYTITMPDGVQADQELIDALSPDFKEFGLTGKQAQKLADRFAEVQTKRAKEYADKPEGQWSMASYAYFQKNGTPDKWAETAKADKEIGGAKWDAKGGTVETAVRAVNTLGTPGLKEYFEASGAGNHPEVIRFMAKVGAMIKEDNPADGGAGGSGKPAEAAHVLFPNDAPKG